MLIKISGIVKSHELMMRVEINAQTVKDYVAAMKDGAIFPPVAITRDPDGTLYLTDGWHRCDARTRLGETEIEAIITDGTFEDAQDAAIASVRANSYGGKKHLDAEKTKAVAMALRMKRHQNKTSRIIANIVGVSHWLVLKVLKTQKQESAGSNFQQNPGNTVTDASNPHQIVHNHPQQPAKRMGDPARMPKRSKGEIRREQEAQASVKAALRKPMPILKSTISDEEFAKANLHEYRHVRGRPIEEEILDNNQRAARAFSATVRDFGEAAIAFLKRVEKEGRFERFMHKDDMRPFTPQEYIDTLATMDNGGQVSKQKFDKNFDALVEAIRIIEPYITARKCERS